MRCPAALVAVAALALSGCASSDQPSDQDQVRTAIAGYAEAVGGDDPERVCDLIVTPAHLSRSDAAWERDRERCGDRVGRGRLSAGQAPGDVRVRTVRVRGDRAVARLASGGRVALRRVDDRWRIVTPG